MINTHNQNTQQTSSLNARGIQRLTLVSDAWQPQMNGVVTTLTQLVQQLHKSGVEVDVIHPNDYATMPLPTYPEIPFVWRAKDLEKRMTRFNPDAIHIATEGALGWRARRIALKNRLPFTTAYHTKYPEYIHERFPIPARWIYHILKWFHRPAYNTFVPAPSILNELKRKGFPHLVLMTRGVNTELFNPNRALNQKQSQQTPCYLYVGRVAPEKNITAFLDLELPGQKIVVGKGPDLENLKKTYPDVDFVGPKEGSELAEYYANASVFVFPSLTDTFGVVNLEAIASGTPVAAFPVTGPKDIITQGVNGVLDHDLKTAIEKASLLKTPNSIANSIPDYTWQAATQQFLNHLAIITKET
ncbi:GDP-mannose-dependent alpha-mannosyltransferase [Hydrogenovibrio crunogenus]|uniref:GDP-mannose-dependent alpha-mannosyltransferase n=1 Tax=Hydrogenovibrio crunogenus TaxID=39765 RepID=A0A4P7P0L4_9GAMM|nr:glycosyltransferase family 1 protein [Hydrogenovibrio crunogenus]QBZ83633.1 GDP-mannose-dependent alpha-mannosyltransferase [Hydrogenovibrio crunogenus]RUM92316.1 MAG: glycosyltransferase family 1 protein [Thiomicrospira sp.]